MITISINDDGTCEVRGYEKAGSDEFAPASYTLRLDGVHPETGQSFHIAAGHPAPAREEARLAALRQRRGAPATD